MEPQPQAHRRTDPSQSVTMLGRHSFNTTIQQENVDSWIVLFCVDWFELCQGLWHDYRRMAAHWEHALAPTASSLQNSAVRFAEVDCATDKPLCNENNVKGYPSVIYFKDGKFRGEWEISRGAPSLSTDLSKWIGKELLGKLISEKSPSKRVDRPASDLVNVHLRELSGLLSWKDPASSAVGYLILVIVVVIIVWIAGKGFEVDPKAAVFGIAKQAKEMPRPSALLPELPVMPEPRTIVRSSVVI